MDIGLKTYPLEGHEVSQRVEESEKDEIIEEEDVVFIKGSFWEQKGQFVLCLISLTLGLGSPCWQSDAPEKVDGGAFVVILFILMAFVTLPLSFLELSLGQYTHKGPLKIGNIFINGQGVGYSMIFLTIILAIYFNIMMAYSITYFLYSFDSPLPWTSCTLVGHHVICDNELDKLPICEKFVGEMENNTEANFTISNIDNSLNCQWFNQTPSYAFWKRTSTKNDTEFAFGKFRVKIALSSILAWIIVIISLRSKFEWLEKVLYVTASIALTILLSLFVLLLGQGSFSSALETMLAFNRADFFHISVWKNALMNLFLSLGISTGVLVVYGKFNVLYQKIQRKIAFVNIISFQIILLREALIYGIVGMFQSKYGISLRKVITSEFQLYFVAIPDALSSLNSSGLWSSMYFLMLICMGINVQIGLVITLLESVFEFASEFRKYRDFVLILICSVLCFVGFMFYASFGNGFLYVLHQYGITFGLIGVSIIELLLFVWGHGPIRLMNGSHFSVKTSMSHFIRLCWGLLTPSFLVILYGAILIDDLGYELKTNPVNFTIGIFFLVLIIFPALLGAILSLLRMNK